MQQLVLALVGGVALAAVATWFWRRWRRAQLAAARRLAMLEFAGLRAPLEVEFLQAAAATGKPRGLRWKGCQLGAPELFAIDRASGELYALSAVTVSFEAVAGGGMEDVEAVSNLRSATAIFAHRKGRWTTDGRVVFNLEPAEALERFQETLATVEL